MALYTLYHVKPEHFSNIMFATDVKEYIAEHGFKNVYRNVGMIEADTLDDVYALTQHLYDSWVLNGRQEGWLHVLFMQSPRSTSVNDVIRASTDGSRFIVSDFGFELLDADPDLEVDLLP